MKKFLFLLALSITSISQAQTPFSGGYRAFSVLNSDIAENSPSTLYAVDTTNVQMTTLAAITKSSDGSSLNINALAYNIENHFLYGLNDPTGSGQPDLYKIDASGTAYLQTTLLPPTSNVRGAILGFVGDSKEGIYYFPALSINSVTPLDYTLYLGSVDLNNNSLGTTYTPKYEPMQLSSTAQSMLGTFLVQYCTAIIAGTPKPSGGIQDWAFNPRDGKIYSYLGVERMIFQLDITNLKGEVFPTQNPSTTEIGGIFFDLSGEMYGLEVETGKTGRYTVDNCPGANCGTAISGTDFQPNTRGDAASCVQENLICNCPPLVNGCDKAYAILNDASSTSAPSVLYSVDTTTIGLSTIGTITNTATGGTLQLNGLGYNDDDGYLYAMRFPPNATVPRLYKIGNTGSSTYISALQLPPTTIPNGSGIIPFVADMQGGVYYFPALSVTSLRPLSYTLYLGIVDIADITTTSYMPTYRPITLSPAAETMLSSFLADYATYLAYGSPQPSGGIQDWAFSPIDGNIYSYLGIEQMVFKLDMDTRYGDVFTTTNTALSEFGGIFFDKSGDMYGLEVEPGRSYRINALSCPNPPCGLLQSGVPFAVNSRGDAAACSIIPVRPTVPTPFTGCPGRSFVVLNDQPGNTDPSTLFSVDTTSIGITAIANLGLAINGLAYNAQDNFLYGTNSPDLDTVNLYKIGSNGLTQKIGQILPPSGGFARAVLGFAADIDGETGMYYFPAMRVNTLFPTITYSYYLGKVNLATATGPTITPIYIPLVLDPLCQASSNAFLTAYLNYLVTGTAQPSGGIQDFAFSPIDGKIWSYLGVEGYMMEMDPSTGATKCHMTSNAPLTEFGAIFFDRTGDMYGFEVDAGRTYKIDNRCPGPDCGALTAGNTHAIDQRGDGASCITSRNITFPVDLVEFDGKEDNCRIQLIWKTASEHRSSHFLVQRSSDGINFSTIGKVQAAGESDRLLTYTFSDGAIDVNNYYRLKQIDTDGGFTYFGPKKISSSCYLDNKTYNLYDLYPNPTSDLLNFKFYVPEGEQEVLITVSDMTGRVVISQKRTMYTGANLYDIDVKGLSNGVYYIRAVSESWYTKAKMFVKD